MSGTAVCRPKELDISLNWSGEPLRFRSLSPSCPSERRSSRLALLANDFQNWVSSLLVNVGDSPMVNDSIIILIMIAICNSAAEKNNEPDRISGSYPAISVRREGNSPVRYAKRIASAIEIH